MSLSLADVKQQLIDYEDQLVSLHYAQIYCRAMLECASDLDLMKTKNAIQERVYNAMYPEVRSIAEWGEILRKVKDKVDINGTVSKYFCHEDPAIGRREIQITNYKKIVTVRSDGSVSEKECDLVNYTISYDRIRNRFLCSRNSIMWIMYPSLNKYQKIEIFGPLYVFGKYFISKKNRNINVYSRRLAFIRRQTFDKMIIKFQKINEEQFALFFIEQIWIINCKLEILRKFDCKATNAIAGPGLRAVSFGRGRKSICCLITGKKYDLVGDRVMRTVINPDENTPKHILMDRVWVD